MSKQINKSEHAEQVELFRWLARVAYCGLRCADNDIKDKEQYEPVKGLELAFAIPNGGARAGKGDSESAVIAGARLKAEGVKAGVPDVFIPYPVGGYHGLFIEMKKEKGGVLSEKQKTMISKLKQQGYVAEVAHGAEKAKKIVRDYLNGIR